MMNRRQFVCTGTAALLAHVPKARAAAYDLLIKGGCVISPAGELHDMNAANVALVQGAIARHRDVVVGVKARLSENVADANDLEALRRAQEAAAPFNLPVMIHIGQSY